MRVCLVYDCLFPHTVGGAERWYRNLAERLAAEGHEVTYLTLRQWPRGSYPGVPGVDVRAVGPRMALYTDSGRRRILPPLVFGLGVLWHLLRAGHHYDVLHTASFPYFSLLAAALARPRGRYRVFVDWHEVWSRQYWREYLGRLGGDVGWLVQLMCARVPQRAFCRTHLHAARLQAEGLKGEITLVAGVYDGPLDVDPRLNADPLVVFAGRHIPEKQPIVIPPAVAYARQQLPELRAAILGNGPQRPQVLRSVAELGLDGTVEVPGFVAGERGEELLGRALCMLLPSRREGLGAIVIEAAARGTPSIVVAHPDNAAVELIEEGENGFVSPSATAEDLARAILRVHEAGSALRASTAVWFARNARRLSLAGSLAVVVEAYGDGAPARRATISLSTAACSSPSRRQS
jgi:glycosyltransferase involved in cell wall biosynthesis